MSIPSRSQSPSDKSDRGPEPGHETPGGVVGRVVGVLLILGAGLFWLKPTAKEVDGQALIEEAFHPSGPLPFGLEVSSALDFPNGETLVLLSDPALPTEDTESPRWEVYKPKRNWYGGQASKHGAPKELFDWSTLPIGEEGTAPIEAAFTWFPPKSGGKALKAQFNQIRYQDIALSSAFGRATPVDSGHLDWGPYQAPFVQVRHFGRDEDGPGFWDTLRVNLTLGEQARILYLRWPRGIPGHLEAAASMLAVLDPGS